MAFKSPSQKLTFYLSHRRGKGQMRKESQADRGMETKTGGGGALPVLLLALGHTDNCLLCANSGGLALVEFVQCVGEWQKKKKYLW